eukprot:COSAG02_NODE_35669_length_465_cov_0.814208_1_plen_37_part_10
MHDAWPMQFKVGVAASAADWPKRSTIRDMQFLDHEGY